MASEYKLIYTGAEVQERLTKVGTIPTKVSKLENDSGYVTASSVPTKVSQLANDSDYATKQYVNDAVGSDGGSAAVDNQTIGTNSNGQIEVKDGGVSVAKIADVQALRNSMGLGNTTGALPVANGGTGATTASAALSNLGITISTSTAPATGTPNTIYIQLL